MQKWLYSTNIKSWRFYGSFKKFLRWSLSKLTPFSSRNLIIEDASSVIILTIFSSPEDAARQKFGWTCHSSSRQINLIPSNHLAGKLTLSQRGHRPTDFPRKGEAIPGLFYFLGLFRQTLSSVLQYVWKMFIRYLVPGFEPTTSWTRVSSHNH